MFWPDQEIIQKMTTSKNIKCITIKNYIVFTKGGLEMAYKKPLSEKYTTGSPRTIWTEEKINEIISKMDKYTDESDLPILAEFAYQNNILRSQLYEYPEFANAIKRMMDKKEAQLEKLGAFNVINSTMAVFSLKQLGWTDKQQIEHSGEINNITREEREARIKELLKKADD